MALAAPMSVTTSTRQHHASTVIHLGEPSRAWSCHIFVRDTVYSTKMCWTSMDNAARGSPLTTPTHTPCAMPTAMAAPSAIAAAVLSGPKTSCSATTLTEMLSGTWKRKKSSEGHLRREGRGLVRHRSPREDGGAYRQVDEPGQVEDEGKVQVEELLVERHPLGGGRVVVEPNEDGKGSQAQHLGGDQVLEMWESWVES